MNVKLHSLRERARQVASKYSKCEAELISVIQEVSRARAFEKWGFTSLFDYCVRELKLSEASSCNFTAVARKAAEVPALAAAIQAGELSVSKARKIVPVLTNDNHDEWLSLAKNSTTRQVEKAVAVANPQAIVKEKLKYVGENRVLMTAEFSEEEIGLLKRVADLVSQKTKKACSQREALVAGLRSYIERNDPVAKAERATTRVECSGAGLTKLQNRKNETSAFPHAGSTQSLRKSVAGQKHKRQTYPAALVHAVTIRDERQCTRRSIDGSRCGATRWLDVHHIVPRSIGGADTLENLTTLCSAHHRMEHRRE